MEVIYFIIIWSFIPLFPWRLCKLLEANPHIFEGVIGEKKAKKMFKFYSIVSILIMIILPLWQPNQIHMLLNLWWIILIFFSGTYAITHRSKIDIAVAKIKNLKWGKKK